MPNPETVFVTGASGYIAKHIILKLLNAGYAVTGSVRSAAREDEVRAAVAPHLDDPEGLDRRLRFAVLDLEKDDGWDAALRGADVLMHTASPFPMTQPDDPQQLIRPAVDGALRALRAAQAAGIGRVVLTSSSVAVMGSAGNDAGKTHTEDDWTDPDAPGVTAYARSKTLAERAAWAFVRDEAPDMALTVINPVLVLGPPLDGQFGTSVGLVQRLLRARDPMLPRFGIGVVDVRDVAEMHLRALTATGAAGNRHIAADRFIWFHEMAETLKAAYPGRRIVTRRAPDVMVRLLALFDKSVRSILPDLGKTREISNARAREVMGIAFIPAERSVRDTADWLIAHDAV
jgi:dihydroflavonol-4-reductase